MPCIRFRSVARRSARRTASAGFTLIELLVVIAIIAILAAILFPVFAQAREKARQTTCLSNEKQMGLGILSYAQDYDEAYPRGYYLRPGTSNTWEWTTWHVLAEPYIKNGVRDISGSGWRVSIDGIFRCPTVSADADSVYGGHSLLMPGYYKFDSGNAAAAIPSRALADVSRPADTILVTELGVVPEWNAAGREGMTASFGPHTSDGAALEGANSGAKFDKDSGTWPHYIMPRYRHSGTANVLFADGHAKSMAKGKLNWCRNVYFPGMTEVWTEPAAPWSYDGLFRDACPGFQP